MFLERRVRQIRKTVFGECMKTIMIHIFVILIGLGLYQLNSDYFERVTTACVVLDKLETTTQHKRNYTNQFLLVVQLPDKTITDFTVRPYIWSQAKVGDTLYFGISQEDLHHSWQKLGIRILSILLMVLPFFSFGLIKFMDELGIK